MPDVADVVRDEVFEPEADAGRAASVGRRRRAGLVRRRRRTLATARRRRVRALHVSYKPKNFIVKKQNTPANF